ncbi:MAG: hypothetical protein AAF908_01475 [Pseudomonadota bacterium]
MTGTTTLTWDGDDAAGTLTPTGLGGLDITSNGGMALDRFLVDVLSSDLPGSSLTISVFDTSGNASVATVGFTDAIFTPVEQAFLFTSFLGSADFTDVGALQFELTGLPKVDIAIDRIQISGSAAVIPLPGGAVLLLSGLGAFWVAGRRWAA